MESANKKYVLKRFNQAVTILSKDKKYLNVSSSFKQEKSEGNL